MDDSRDIWSGWSALVVTASLQIWLPERMSAGPGWSVVAVVSILAAGGLATRGRHRHRAHHVIAHLTAGIVTAALGYSTAALISGLAAHLGAPVDVLRSAGLLWASNVLVFACWYWRLDAGGPHERSKRDFHATGAFLFPQMTLPEPARPAHGVAGWRPSFMDYLFIAFNTSTAFSPTDVPVLSRWAKALMMTQAIISLTTLAVVAARAVNIL
jgi:hypothetical protein